MPVQFVCEHCGKTLRVRDDLAGRRIKCPKCQGVVRVPAQVVAEKWFLQTEDGETYGPVDRGELDQWSREGRITGDCQVLREGSDQWQWATDLYPHLGPEAAPAAPAETLAPQPQDPQVSQKPHVAGPASASRSTPSLKSAESRSPAKSSPALPFPSQPTPTTGSGVFDFAAKETPAPVAKQPGPFDFAPAETAPTAPSGPFNFSDSGAGTRGRATAKKGKKTTKAKAVPAMTPAAGEAAKSKVVALLLAFFLGTLGVHRFYLGYTTIGVLMLVTFGGCGVWALVDFILIAIGKVDRDAQGRPLA
jgi:hypothetical protein